PRFQSVTISTRMRRLRVQISLPELNASFLTSNAVIPVSCLRFKPNRYPLTSPATLRIVPQTMAGIVPIGRCSLRDTLRTPCWTRDSTTNGISGDAHTYRRRRVHVHLLLRLPPIITPERYLSLIQFLILSRFTCCTPAVGSN